MFYLRYYASNGTDTGFYIPTIFSLGTDADGDGFYTQDWEFNGRDCDDTDLAIAPGQAETPGDGVDSNCDGLDDT